MVFVYTRIPVQYTEYSSDGGEVQDGVAPTQVRSLLNVTTSFFFYSYSVLLPVIALLVG